MTFQQAGDSFLYLRGSKSEFTLLSFPADFLILNEFDRIAPKAVVLAKGYKISNPDDSQTTYSCNVRLAEVGSR